jgi:S-adenosylmethionine:tRNA ribosyltransferase-isomerase
MTAQFIATSYFQYDLPNERIAYYPLEKRDESKLLIYKNQQITTTQFKHIADYLPDNSLTCFQ